MVDYSKSCIYKLSSYDNDLIYIGSTTQILCKRLYQHKTKMNCTSKILFENSNNVFITLLESVTATNKQELHAIERRYIENFDCVNKQIPTRTKQEYYQDNRDVIAEKTRIYQQKNKEKISEQYQLYYQDNKEKISEQQQEYYQDNKEKIIEKIRIYRQKNKDIIAEKRQVYNQNNKKMIAEKTRIYQQKNKEEIVEKRQVYNQKNKENINHRQYWIYHKELFDKIKPLFYDM